MADHAVTFSSEKVRATLREIEQPGTGKRQERIVLKPQPVSHTPGRWSWEGKTRGAAATYFNGDEEFMGWSLCEQATPYQPGDRLWVREAHYLTDDGHEEYAVFAADTDDVTAHMADVDGLPPTFPAELRAKHRKLRPSIYMPRWASRLTLTVTEVRVQRLQEISNEDCIAEGIPLHFDENVPRVGHAIDDFARNHGLISHYGAEYRRLWDSINAGRAPWDSNPWVVAVTFTPALANIDGASHG